MFTPLPRFKTKKVWIVNRILGKNSILHLHNISIHKWFFVVVQCSSCILLSISRNKLKIIDCLPLNPLCVFSHWVKWRKYAKRIKSFEMGCVRYTWMKRQHLCVPNIVHSTRLTIKRMFVFYLCIEIGSRLRRAKDEKHISEKHFVANVRVLPKRNHVFVRLKVRRLFSFRLVKHFVLNAML